VRVVKLKEGRNEVRITYMWVTHVSYMLPRYATNLFVTMLYVAIIVGRRSGIPT